jgi:translation initiation factor IF-2
MTTDTKSPGEKLSVSSTKTLTIKPRAETSVVRQSFSHGRQKTVVLEKVKRRTLTPGGKAEAKAPEQTPATTPGDRDASDADCHAVNSFAEAVRRRAAHAHRGRAKPPRACAR